MENKERNITPEEAIILWHASRLDLSEDYEQAPEILKVQGSVIGTLGNFSASIGKAKSKKTFNVSAIVAAALKNGTVLNYTAELPENKRKILYVDTEQSSYHCAKVARRSLRMAGLPTGSNHENLEYLVQRKYTPEERIALEREAIYRTENVGLVIIDGIRDMVYDINSPGESTKVISLLMTWTGERNIHIHTILHQNKGDEHARGHIGTELSNKAETVLQVEKDENNPDISTVKTAHIRAVDFEPFAFRINEEALPELLEDYQFKDKDETKGNREKFDPYKDITERQHRIALEAAFTLKDEYGYQELAEALQEAYASVGVTLGDNKVVKLITMLKSKRMIVQENGWGSRRQSMVCRRSDSALPCILFSPAPYLSPSAADRNTRRGKRAAPPPTVGSSVLRVPACQKKRRPDARRAPAPLSVPKGRAGCRMRRVPAPVR